MQDTSYMKIVLSNSGTFSNDINQRNTIWFDGSLYVFIWKMANGNLTGYLCSTAAVLV